MAQKLTKSFIDSVPLLESGQTFYRDNELKGFGLRVGTTGKVYIAEGKIRNKVVRVTIGKHGVYTAEQARLRARELLLMMTKGINPNDIEKEEKARGVTLEQAIADYLSVRKSLKPNTIIDYQKCIDCYLSDWKQRPLLEITKDMVAKRHTLIGQRSKAQANLSMRYLRAIFNFAAG
ncbi:MAG TPA: Arm DNA-binding domain-containing protein, partial [Gallionellaceae bacterium]|nr:Arm DNA-binding domain-containing protein [Gallionellaceae bacterium]